MTAIDIPALALRLNDGQTPRVWSLLVTVFGDLAQEDGAVVQGSDLRQIMAAIGIKPEAMRVALHRLRNEGWIESTKTGRTSTYKLSALGRRESQSASPLIYGDVVPDAEACLSVHNSELMPVQGRRIAPHLTLASSVINDPEALNFSIDATTRLPLWLREMICDPSLVEQSQVLAAAMQDCTQRLDVITTMTKHDQLALRIVLLHGWRRIVLKAPHLPDHVFPKGWQGHLCRSSLRDLLARLSSVDLG